MVSTRHCGPVDLRGNSIERYGDIGTRHLRIQICLDSMLHHDKHAFTLDVLAGGLNGLGYFAEVVFEYGAEQSLLVGIVLVERADGHASPLGDARCRQALRPFAEQNLNGRLMNGRHGRHRPRLRRRFPWVQCGGRCLGQKRIPYLKVSSDNHCSEVMAAQQRQYSPNLWETALMSNSSGSTTFRLGTRIVNRFGYGAMQLAGSGAFGPPRNHAEALAVLREAVASGVNHIDTSDFYGPHITNTIIREALHPYPDDLTIVTKIGAKRGPQGSWEPTFSRESLIGAVHDNLRNLGLDTLEVVNLRAMFHPHKPAEGSLDAQLEVLAGLQQKGLIRHIGLSHVTPKQISDARKICDIVCVQNHYNLAHRDDEALIDELCRDGIAYVPYFPAGGFTPLQSEALAVVAKYLDATPRQVALAWLLARASNILLIPGTSSIAHLRENLAAAGLTFPDGGAMRLNFIGGADAS